MTYDTINDAVTMRPGGGAALGRIDQYELVRELGGGGFGTVYLARDTVAGVEVAVKGLPPFVKNNREEMENIRRNFALVSRLHHPNIAAALVLHPAKDVSYAYEEVRQKLRVVPGDALMVMEYAPGVTLSQWRRQFPDCKVPMDKSLGIVRQVAAALDYAHERKIVHRDVKPANVMVETSADGGLTARVLDFGLAAEIRSSMGRVSREIRDTSGTRPYMAPEQWLGGRQGPATDQYALAVLFYELATGEVPFVSVFDTGDPVVMMNVVGREPFVPPDGLAKPVRLALAKALAKKPEDRFASCGEFVAALDGKVKVSRGGAEAWRSGKTMLVASVLGIGAIVGGWWYHVLRQETARREQVRIVVEQKAETERKAHDEAVRKAEEMRQAKEKAEQKAAAERKAKEETALKALEEAARAKAEMERERQKNAEAARKAKVEAEAARKALEEAARAKAEMEMQRRKAAEEERKAKVEAERWRREETRISVKNNPAPAKQSVVQSVWISGSYVDQVKADGTVTRVWQPGHYEQKTIEVPVKDKVSDSPSFEVKPDVPVDVQLPAPAKQSVVQSVWVSGCYVDQVKADGTVTRVWQPGHYETRNGAK